MTYYKRPDLGQATMANSEPVVIASDQSAVPVSATNLDIRDLTNTDVVTAELSATDNAVLDAIAASVAAIDTDTTTIIGHVDGIETLLGTIDADTSALAGTVAGTELQVDVVGALPAGTNNIGDVDVLSMPATGVEDAPETAGGTLMMAGTVRRDTAASSAGTTGDNATLNTDSLGRLWISGAAVEDAAETAGGILLMAGSVRRDTAASSAGTTGDNATINTDSVGALWTRDTATQVDDAAFTPATGRVMPIGFLADETATDSVDEGDAGVARMTLNRRQIMAGNMVDDAAFTVGTDYANPIAGVAVNMDGTDPLAVSAEGDVAALRSDPNRILLVNQTHARFWHVSADYASAQTNVSVKAAAGASLSLYITDIVISNGATAGNITLLDGSGGTVLFEIYPAINGGATISLRNPIKLTANTALCLTSTTVTTHSVFISGYIAA